MRTGATFLFSQPASSIRRVRGRERGFAIPATSASRRATLPQRRSRAGSKSRRAAGLPLRFLRVRSVTGGKRECSRGRQGRKIVEPIFIGGERNARIAHAQQPLVIRYRLRAVRKLAERQRFAAIGRSFRAVGLRHALPLLGRRERSHLSATGAWGLPTVPGSGDSIRLLRAAT